MYVHEYTQTSHLSECQSGSDYNSHSILSQLQIVALMHNMIETTSHTLGFYGLDDLK